MTESRLPENVRAGEPLKVSANTNPQKLAGLVDALIKEEGVATLQAVGAGAVNQALKAATIAKGFAAPNGYDLVVSPAFVDLDVDGKEKTGLKLVVENR